MKSLPWWTVPLALVGGLALGIGFSFLRFNKQVSALKARGDSVAAVAAQATARADSEHAAVVAIVAQRDSVEQHAKSVAVTADRRVKAFHDALHATVAHDSAASAELDSLTAAFAADTLARNNAITAADAKVNFLTNENAQLLATVHALNGQIQGLNAEIQKLNAPPSLALKILKGASYVGTAIAAYEVGKH